jgi:hypothetical protein
MPRLGLPSIDPRIRITDDSAQRAVERLERDFPQATSRGVDEAARLMGQRV